MILLTLIALGHFYGLYLDLIFQNIQTRFGIYNNTKAYAKLREFTATADWWDQIGLAMPVQASSGWGLSVTGAATASAIFLCETPVMPTSMLIIHVPLVFHSITEWRQW
ncbi:MAG: hypothetical protein ACJASL_003568 [Paraglaciecola sp.]